MGNFKFSNIIVRELANSFIKAEGTAGKNVDVIKARKQHAKYVEAFERAGVKVKKLPKAEPFPDSVFVEDVAIIIDNVALITKPGAESRSKEVQGISTILSSFDLKVKEVTDPTAKLDGGDVIFTGKEIIMGLSKRTNEAGHNAVKKAFPGYKTVVVDVLGPLHLTTMMHLCDDDTFCISTETGNSSKMFQQLCAKSDVTYASVKVPKDNAANCIRVNDHLICKSENENPYSYQALKKALPAVTLIGLDLSEIEKATGSISCMSLRFKKPS